MTGMRDVYVVDAVRTPVGRHGGALAGVRPDDLGTVPIRALLERNDLPAATVDEVVYGCANQAGEDNRNVARMSALLAGLPTSTTGVTVNRLCGSGLEAVVQGWRTIAMGEADVVVAGGVESMSRAPWVLPKPERGYARAHAELFSTTLGWRMVNERMPDQWTVPLGEGSEILSEQRGITREHQDAFALRSHRNAAAAWDAGRFDDEVVLVPGPDGAPLLERDETMRPDTSMAALGKLSPVFRDDGTVTAGNASPLSDGAAAVLLAPLPVAEDLGREPLARIRSSATWGVDPHLFGIAPAEASELALRRAGVGWGDVALVELNEAFAGQSLAVLADLAHGLDPEIVNVNGGAIALGHPLGASGARILTTLVHELRRRGGGIGLATLCIGVGQGIALVVEAPSS